MCSNSNSNNNNSNINWIWPRPRWLLNMHQWHHSRQGHVEKLCQPILEVRSNECTCCCNTGTINACCTSLYRVCFSLIVWICVCWMCFSFFMCFFFFLLVFTGMLFEISFVLFFRFSFFFVLFDEEYLVLAPRHIHFFTCSNTLVFFTKFFNATSFCFFFLC